MACLYRQKPLTLALSQRERGLTESVVGDTPTWNTEPNSGLNNMNIAPLSSVEPRSEQHAHRPLS
ncbi:hypothetical protein EMIT0P395_300008 [Pseudomonas sp. IT-P395]